MLRIYLTSVLIYMIIIYAVIYMGQYKIKENGWLDGEKKKGSGVISLLCLSAVPIFRLFVVITVFVMAAMPKEEFEKLKDDMKNESN